MAGVPLAGSRLDWLVYQNGYRDGQLNRDHRSCLGYIKDNN